MTKRHEFSVVIVTSEKVRRETAVECVQLVLNKLTKSDAIHRAYVEGDGLKDKEAGRLYEMLSLVSSSMLSGALESAKILDEEQ